MGQVKPTIFSPLKLAPTLRCVLSFRRKRLDDTPAPGGTPGKLLCPSKLMASRPGSK
jgi:hypothetical protein